MLCDNVRRQQRSPGGGCRLAYVATIHLSGPECGAGACGSGSFTRSAYLARAPTTYGLWSAMVGGAKAFHLAPRCTGTALPFSIHSRLCCFLFVLAQVSRSRLPLSFQT